MVETVTIGSQAYQVYADLETADLYMEAAFQGDTWRAETDLDKKKRALVTSTRTLDRQNWKGERYMEYPYQTLQFPRTNMGIDGLDDSAGVTPEGIIAGSIELALALMDGSDVQNLQTTAERIHSIRAGSVSITNFRGIDIVETRFPLIVQELIGPYLAGADVGFGAKATGVDACSVFPGRYGFTDGV